ncbi:glycolipid transfer protein domain-containing protein [Geopyxis carbonaria]|nr:glycolipid transfer protein domain-containing protein [Geopyxis carbonaria]
MPTFFDTAKRNFQDVPVADGQVPTSEFLEAAESVVALFDVFGSVAFVSVQKDMTGNIKKVRDYQLAHPAESGTLQSLVAHELASKKHTATEGLLWLNRGLEFTQQALRKNYDNQSEQLTESFTAAYEKTLKPHHNFMVKGIFTVAMKACPYRADFYKNLGGDEEQVRPQLHEWLGALENITGINSALLKDVKW